MSDSCDIAIVGAGAAGLAAAIFAAEATQQARRPTRIVLLDGAEKIGAKILISGGGRCNVTHAEVHPEDFNGSRPVVRNILAAFDEDAARQWFTRLGVTLKREETGKLFPVTNSARSVLDALVGRCRALSVELRTAHRVNDVAVTSADRFALRHSQGTLHAGRVILATGGKSLPRTGSDGHGWEIVHRLGHRVTPTFPALVPLVLRSDSFHAAISGLSTEVELTTIVDRKRIDRRTGSLLFTHFGISGPVVMDASRFWVIAHEQGCRAEMRGNFLPEQTPEAVNHALTEAAQTRPRASVGRILGQQLADRLVDSLTGVAGVDPATPIGQLTRAQRRVLVPTLTDFAFPIDRSRGWDFAEVTAGGVPLNEIDYRTMASRKRSGLYVIGEMLDCDGRIGGFNFQWAWSTGYLAGRAAVRSLQS